MPRKVSEIVEEARQLPYGERAELIEQLILANQLDADPKVEKAWADTAMRRLAEIETGNKLAGHELVWLRTRWEAYVITIQGSARLRRSSPKVARPTRPSPNIVAPANAGFL